MLGIKNPPEIYVERKLNKDVDPVIEDFINTLENTSFDLSYFYKNLNSLKINKNVNPGILNKHKFAEYNIDYNYINCYIDDYKIPIMHELLHAATTIKTKDRVFSGFSQYINHTNLIFGEGLNEGFTANLDEKLFSDYSNNKSSTLKNSYYLTQLIVSYLEELVGLDKMMELYSKSDLNGLIDVLTNYMDYDDTLTFISAIDSVFYYGDTSFMFHPFILLENFKYCLDYLVVAFLEGATKNYRNGSITKDEYKEALKAIRSLSKRRLYLGNFKILKTKPMSKDEFKSKVRTINKKYT